VLGKDYLRLNATSLWQESIFDLDVTPNSKLLFIFNDLKGTASYGYAILRELNSSGGTVVSNEIRSTDSNKSRTITLNSQTVKCRLFLGNTATNGTFDFIKPQLYQLDGKEGTINGNPVQLNKAPKYIKYPIR
jgi:hypothetical protein